MVGVVRVPRVPRRQRRAFGPRQARRALRRRASWPRHAHGLCAPVAADLGLVLDGLAFAQRPEAVDVDGGLVVGVGFSRDGVLGGELSCLFDRGPLCSVGEARAGVAALIRRKRARVDLSLALAKRWSRDRDNRERETS